MQLSNALRMSVTELVSRPSMMVTFKQSSSIPFIECIEGVSGNRTAFQHGEGRAVRDVLEHRVRHLEKRNLPKLDSHQRARTPHYEHLSHIDGRGEIERWETHEFSGSRQSTR